jgi:hypothetical protein
MKSALLFTLFTLLLSAMACGGKSAHEEAADDSMNVMEDMIQVLTGITDVDSAKAAAAKLQKLTAEMQDSINKMDELGEFDGEIDPEDAAAYTERSMKASQAFTKEMMRIMQIEGAWDQVAPHLTSLTSPKGGK